MSAGGMAEGITPELIIVVLMVVILVPPHVLLLKNVLKGEFWPGHLLEEFRAGKAEALSDDDRESE